MPGEIMNAFPFTTEIQRTESGSGERHFGEAGMSLRQWYAGQAIAGLLANPDWNQADTEVVVGWAFQIADAMVGRKE